MLLTGANRSSIKLYVFSRTQNKITIGFKHGNRISDIGT